MGARTRRMEVGSNRPVTSVEHDQNLCLFTTDRDPTGVKNLNLCYCNGSLVFLRQAFSHKICPA